MVAYLMLVAFLFIMINFLSTSPMRRSIGMRVRRE